MVTGRCNCASIKVSVAEMPQKSAICFCANCRRQGATAGSIVYMMNKSQVTIEDTKGTLKEYRDGDTTSGNTIIRQFCGTCGSPIASLTSDENSPVIILKGGIFGQLVKPAQTYFPQDQPEWLGVAKM